MLSPQIIGPATVPGAQSPVAGPGADIAQGLATPSGDGGNALSGNEFSWLLAFSGAVATGAPEAVPATQAPVSGQAPGKLTMLFRPPEAAVAAARIQTPPDAGAGTILPPGGEPLPPDPAGRADALQQAVSRTTGAQSHAAQSAAGSGAVDLVSELRGQRWMLRDSRAADTQPVGSLDSALLLDPRTQTQAPAARPQTADIMAPLPSGPAEQPLFDQAVGQRLMFMIRNGSHDARLRVQPERLGNVEIQLKLDGDEARVSLVSPHASVRDALELAIPRLRELLGDAGLALTQFDVGAGDSRSPGQPDGGAQARFGQADPAGDIGIDAAATEAALVMVRAEGLIDTFA